MRKILDANDPFFAPVWRRWATAAFPILWGLFELFVTKSAIWGGMFLAVGLFAFWVLIVQGPDAADTTDEKKPESDPS